MTANSVAVDTMHAPPAHAALHADSHGSHTHAHQFDNASQQHEVAALGMWCFLATEVLFFGAVFAAYSVYRHAYPEEFKVGSLRLYAWIGAINTGVLLCSSLTVALGIRAAHLMDRENIFRCLLATFVLGAMFLAIKTTEYVIDYREHLIPDLNFKLEDKDLENIPQYDQNPPAYQATPLDKGEEAKEVFEHHVELFFLFYFTMTGIHALHMVIGITIMLILAVRVKHGAYKYQNHNSIEMTGLYWHFVDVVWIFLFPLLYLIR